MFMLALVACKQQVIHPSKIEIGTNYNKICYTLLPYLLNEHEKYLLIFCAILDGDLCNEMAKCQNSEK